MQRTLKFTKYLPELGWQPTVVCGDDPHSIAEGLDPSLLDNVSMSFYEAGHMMYVHQPSLHKLKGELAGFIQAATG